MLRECNRSLVKISRDSVLTRSALSTDYQQGWVERCLKGFAPLDGADEPLRAHRLSRDQPNLVIAWTSAF